MAKDTNDPLRTAIRSLTEQRIPGGCDDCDAYQQITEPHPGVFVNTIYHDDDCPTLAQHTKPH